MKIWLCYLDGRLIKGVETYEQAFNWAQAHETLSRETDIKHTLELHELKIEQAKPA